MLLSETLISEVVECYQVGCGYFYCPYSAIALSETLYVD